MVYYISSGNEIGREVHSLSILENLIGFPQLFFDFEADGLDAYTLFPILLGITGGDDNYYVVNLLTIPASDLSAALAPCMDAVWVAHNLKYDYKLLWAQYGLEIRRGYCTMVSSQVLYNGMSALSHSYAACVKRHFKVELDKGERNSFIGRNRNLPIRDAEITYLVNDLRYLMPLFEKQQIIAQRMELTACIQLENEFLPVLAQMELEGIRLDTTKWSEASRIFSRQAEAVRIKLLAEVDRLGNLFPELLTAKLLKTGSKLKKATKYDVPGQLNFLDTVQQQQTVSKARVISYFNIGSTGQIQALYNRCGAPEITSTGEDVLQQYLLNNPESQLRKFTELLLEYRGYQKLITTYGDNFFEFINPVTGRIHTDFSQAFTDTGRLSSSSPNLQNIPGLNGELRECFIPDTQDYLFVDVDMSGQELRVAASYSQDPMMMANFTGGADLHSQLGQDSYRIIKNDPELIVSSTVNKDLRKAHKPLLFSVIYGGGPGGIASKAGIDIERAKKVYKSIFSNLPELNRFQQRVKKKAIREKQIRDGSRYNRVKYFNTHAKTVMEDHQIERQAVNFPIQATSASMVKEAGIALSRYFREHKLDARIKLQVHDQYIIQIPRTRPELGQVIKDIMEEVGTSYLNGIRMESELNINPYWSH